jgi:hypothetical protein
MFLREKPPDQFVAMIREVELELQQPTQQVCQIIDNLASEENCRLYLTAFVTFVREALRKSQRQPHKIGASSAKYSQSRPVTPPTLPG